MIICKLPQVRHTKSYISIQLIHTATSLCHCKYSDGEDHKLAALFENIGFLDIEI